jgi:hypothetical protein
VARRTTLPAVLHHDEAKGITLAKWLLDLWHVVHDQFDSVASRLLDWHAWARPGTPV